MQGASCAVGSAVAAAIVGAGPEGARFIGRHPSRHHEPASVRGHRNRRQPRAAASRRMVRHSLAHDDRGPPHPMPRLCCLFVRQSTGHRCPVDIEHHFSYLQASRVDRVDCERTERSDAAAAKDICNSNLKGSDHCLMSLPPSTTVVPTGRRRALRRNLPWKTRAWWTSLWRTSQAATSTHGLKHQRSRQVVLQHAVDRQTPRGVVTF